MRAKNKKSMSIERFTRFFWTSLFSSIVVATKSKKIYYGKVTCDCKVIKFTCLSILATMNYAPDI